MSHAPTAMSVKVSFTRNPSKPCEFRSVNGALDVYFQPSLNADLNFHTVNGGVYTDFDVTSRPTAGKGESVDGKYLYRVDRRNMNARTGSNRIQDTMVSLRVI